VDVHSAEDYEESEEYVVDSIVAQKGRGTCTTWSSGRLALLYAWHILVTSLLIHTLGKTCLHVHQPHSYFLAKRLFNATASQVLTPAL